MRGLRPALPPGPYLVAGLGAAGSAAASALIEVAGPRLVHVCDESVAPPVKARAAVLERRGARVRLGELAHHHLGSIGCVVKSPGMAPDVPLLQAARRAGILVIDELELGWRLQERPLIGVTGTNGKSTTVALIAGVLGDACQAGNSEFHPPLSAVPSRGGPVVCEVSSYQLEGTTGLVADLGVLTNLTRDHLHRHRSMRAYGEAKRRLFTRAGRAAPMAVIGVDQALGRRLAGELATAGSEVLTVGRSAAAAFRLLRCEPDARGWTLDALVHGGPLRLCGVPPGRHGGLNALTALAVGELLGVERSTAQRAIAGTPHLPGRFEHIEAGQPFAAVVDFAHTPDAVELALEAARAITEKRLHVVMSAAGLHDPGKRPSMGSIARGRADRLILTRGALYGERLGSVLADLQRGASAAGVPAEVEPDRRRALAGALDGAEEGDTVITLGRGALSRMSDSLDGEGPPFDDRVALRELLAERGYSDGSDAAAHSASPTGAVERHGDA